MKNIFKTKRIFSLLLTMIMLTSLFLFSGCGEDEEKLLFKIIYRPSISSYCAGGFFLSYEEIVKEDIERTSANLLSRVVGAFGIGEIEIEGRDDYITLSPIVPEYYYENLLGINESCENYSNIISKLSQTTNIIYSGFTDNYQNKRVLILSNRSVVKHSTGSNSSDEITDLVDYEEDTGRYIAKAYLIDVMGNATTHYNAGQEIYPNCIYFYQSGDDVSFIFLGSYAYLPRYSLNGASNVENYLKRLLTTNYNNIQQTLDYLYVVEDVDTTITSTKWKYSLTDSEYNSVWYPSDFLYLYMNKYEYDFRVGYLRAMLTRCDCVLTDELEGLYQNAIRSSASKKDKENFINACCEYVDHLGFAEEEIDSFIEFLSEVVIGEDILYNNEAIIESCREMLMGAVEDVSPVPLLEIVCFKGDEIDSVEIDGYIQSVIIFKGEGDQLEFTDASVCFDGDDLEGCEPYVVTLRCQSYGELKEYPYGEAEEFEDIVGVGLEDISSDETSLPIRVCSDPIPKPLITNTVSVYTEYKKYADKFVFSTSTPNSQGLAWCYNNESVDFVEIVLGRPKLRVDEYTTVKSLCVNQKVNLAFVTC